MIRAFEARDLDTVMNIWLEGNLQAHPFIPASYWHDHYEMVKGLLPEADIQVYEDKEGIKGFIGLGEGGYVAGLFVSVRHQSAGIGSQLLQTCQANNDRLVLDVYVKNEKAVRFYRRLGFLVSEEKINPTSNEQEFTMVWSRE